MHDEVLIPTDGSPGAEGATARAFDITHPGSYVEVLQRFRREVSEYEQDWINW